jgi:GT2 family glycosyltransferase
VRRQLLEEVGYFDENFFLYYEEVDLCRRIKAKGFSVRYWPDVVVVHLGGESSKTVTNVAFSKSGSQLALWRMRAAMLYYRKHHGPMVALLAMRLELYWHLLRVLSNRRNSDPIRKAKAEAAANLAGLVRQAWKETQGGKLCPPRPW